MLREIICASYLHDWKMIEQDLEFRNLAQESVYVTLRS